jgi:hypothetical protein
VHNNIRIVGSGVFYVVRSEDIYRGKFNRQRENKVLRIIGNFPRRTPVRELHKAWHGLDNITTKFTEIGCKDLVWIHLVQGRDEIRVLVNAAVDVQRDVTHSGGY